MSLVTTFEQVKILQEIERKLEAERRKQSFVSRLKIYRKIRRYLKDNFGSLYSFVRSTSNTLFWLRVFIHLFYIY